MRIGIAECAVGTALLSVPERGWEERAADSPELTPHSSQPCVGAKRVEISAGEPGVHLAGDVLEIDVRVKRELASQRLRTDTTLLLFL